MKRFNTSSRIINIIHNVIKKSTAFITSIYKCEDINHVDEKYDNIKNDQDRRWDDKEEEKLWKGEPKLEG